MHSRSPVVLFISIVFSLLSLFITPQIEAKFALSPMENTANKDLSGITGNSPTDVYAVGKKGTILHFDGTQCKQLPTPSRKNLNGVWGSFEKGNTNVFAVGDRGTILYFDGTQCKQLPNPSRKDLNGVWGSFEKGSINIFAVGDRGTILHFDGQQWFEMSNPEQSKLNGIWGSSKNSIFAVGEEGTILHFDGTRWLSLPKHTLEDLNSVSGCYENTAINVYAVGKKGTILHFDGAQWTKMNSSVYNNLNDIYGRQPNNIFAVGQGNTVIHFDGDKWSQVSEPDNTNLFAVWVSENPHVFVVSENGFSFPYGEYAIKGAIYDSCSNCTVTPPARTLIPGSQVEALVGGSWVVRRTATNGTYDAITFTSANNTLRFSAGSDYKAELRSVTLLPTKNIETNTYLLHNTHSLTCISGVISRIPPAYPNFYQSIIPPTIISINLLRLNCTWSVFATTTTNSEGHYCFSGLSAGTYKVVPQIAGYIPEYDNIYIAIPQATPQAYNFKEQ